MSMNRSNTRVAAWIQISHLPPSTASSPRGHAISFLDPNPTHTHTHTQRENGFHCGLLLPWPPSACWTSSRSRTPASSALVPSRPARPRCAGSASTGGEGAVATAKSGKEGVAGKCQPTRSFASGWFPASPSSGEATLHLLVFTISRSGGAARRAADHHEEAAARTRRCSSSSSCSATATAARRSPTDEERRRGGG